MSFKVEKINGKADDKYASGVFSKRVTLSDDTSGVFALNVIIWGDGLETIENINTFLQEGFESDAKKLEEANGQILTTLGEIRDSATSHFAQMSLKGDFVLTFFYKQAVYVAKVGDKVKVTVYRPPKSFEVSFDLGSGKLVGGDLVVVSSQKFVETFDSNVFASGDNLDFEDIVDGLATDIASTEDQSEISVIFVQVPHAGEKPSEKLKEEEPVEKSENLPQSEVAVEPTSDREIREVPGRVGIGGGIVGKIFGELSKLRVGDVGAIFRLRRLLIIGALILAVGLGISGYITIKGKMDAGKEAKISEHLSVAEAKYSEAMGIFDLNKEKARQLLVDAQSAVNEALSVSPKNEKALKLKDEISSKLKETENLAIVNFSTFYDGKSSISAISRGSADFYVFGGNGVFKVDSQGKGDQFSEEKADGGGYVYDKSVFVLSGGKASIIDANGKAKEVGKAQNVHDIGVFFGNVYLMGADNIFKFVPIEGGYAPSSNYLENSVSFAGESRFAIDGSIWVTNGQDILQFTRGASDNFSFSGVNGVGTFGEIYTNADSSKVYVIDKANSALLVIGKDGLYEKSYNSSEFAKAADLYVDESGGKLYIASGSKILVADL